MPINGLTAAPVPSWRDENLMKPGPVRRGFAPDGPPLALTQPGWRMRKANLGVRGRRALRGRPEPMLKQKAVSMARNLVAHNRPVFDQLHPGIYGAAVGLVVWFALSAWVLFDRQSDIGLPLAMVSALLFIAVLLPWSLFLIWKRHRMPHQRHPEEISFRDWRAGDFAVWGSKLHGTDAAIDLLLPLAAVAFGLTALGIVFLICASVAP